MTCGRRCMLWPLGLAMVLLSGCGQTFGGLLYHLRLLPRTKVPAQFALCTGPVLVLVDDDMELVTWPPAQDRLADEIALHFRDAEVPCEILPGQNIERLRQTDPDFENRAISDVGQELGAERVLWIQIREFVATKEIDAPSRAARLVIRLKVFDPNASRRSELRLWPADREGHLLAVEKRAIDIQTLDSDEAIARLLVKEMADEVALLFYDHEVEE